LPFGWVRLAQRIPGRIHIDKVPPDIILSAGMTATVEIEERPPVKSGTTDLGVRSFYGWTRRRLRE
jgi:multidrug resistance efflux pump